VNDEPERAIYPPAAYLETTRRIIEHNGLRRTVEEDSDSAPPPFTRMSVNVRRDHNLAFVRVEEPGEDLQELVRLRLRELCLHRVDCIYLDLPLSHPATSRTGGGIGELGFFFGCIIPEAHGGAVGGDIFRLQYLNEVEIKADDLSTASDFGQELVEFIFQQKRTVGQ